MNSSDRPLALVTGASSGIGRQLAIECAQHGFDMVVAADTSLDDVVGELRRYAESVEPVQADLSTAAGVDQVYAALQGRSVDALLADPGHDPGRRFFDTHITGTVYLVQKVARDMVAEGVGRILITGSIAGIDSFARALRNELQESGVTVTCLMPGPIDSNFFARADLTAEVARVGYEAMIEGAADVAAGLRNPSQDVRAWYSKEMIMAKRSRPRGGIEGSKEASPRTLPPDARVSTHGADGEGGAEEQAVARPARRNGMEGRKAPRR